MSFGFYFLVSLLPIYVTDALSVYIAFLLAGRKMPYRKVFALQIPAAIMQSAAYSAAYVMLGNRTDEPMFYLKDMIFHTFELVIMLSWVYFFFRNMHIHKRFFYMYIAYPIVMTADQLAFTLIGMMSEELLWGGGTGGNFSETPVNLFLIYASFLFAIGSTAAVVRTISRTSLWSKLQAFENYPKLYVPMGIFCFLFYIIFITFAIQFMSKSLISPFASLAYLALLASIVLMVSDIKKTENLTAAKNLLLQQQNYISKLESIQREIRGIQHDYKNMLAGLYAQASEGNTEAVKEYISTKLLMVDEAVREDLSQMNQLTRIEIPELKGLIMTKMLEAERDKVPFRLEAMFPVNKASMATEDLLRCVGVLLDNAIEEARTQENAAVTLLLLQEEDGELTIVVKNPVRVKPDLSQIRNEGYSTKGAGRGIGLYNYMNIIRKYPDATQETKITEEYFVQVLALAGK